jgi:hypothetical protein
LAYGIPSPCSDSEMLPFLLCSLLFLVARKISLTFSIHVIR